MNIIEVIKHICKFTSNIWQVHPFCEGNTRTTAVFMIKYIISLGFSVNEEVFAKNSWYYRNSLVRANYSNNEKNIIENTIFLERFYTNLLVDSEYNLKNEYTHIDYHANADKE